MTVRRFIPPALISAGVIATFAPVIANQFVIYDDLKWIAENPQLRPPSLASLLQFWLHPVEGLYVPVTWSYWSSLAAMRMDPAVFHAGSVLLHLLSAMVVFAILHGLV